MKYLKLYENKKLTSYYSIRWLNLNGSSNEKDWYFGEAEGRFETLDEITEYINPEFPIDKLNVEFMIVRIDETPVDKEELKLWFETKKYNL